MVYKIREIKLLFKITIWYQKIVCLMMVIYSVFMFTVYQFYMYKNKNGWMGYDKYCFIKPLESQDSYLKKNSKYEPLTGTVKYINQDLLNKGVKVGDVVLYQPDSEYEFRVDDELLYRMFTNNITVVL